eukprot:2345648-Pyramimonas_sp.AAC.1
MSKSSLGIASTRDTCDAREHRARRISSHRCLNPLKVAIDVLVHELLRIAVLLDALAIDHLGQFGDDAHARCVSPRGATDDAAHRA